MTRMSGSASKAASTSGAWRAHISTETAFRRSGLLKIIQPIWPSLRPISFSVPTSMGALLSSYDSPISLQVTVIVLPAASANGWSSGSLQSSVLFWVVWFPETTVI